MNAPAGGLWLWVSHVGPGLAPVTTGNMAGVPIATGREQKVRVRATHPLDWLLTLVHGAISTRGGGGLKKELAGRGWTGSGLCGGLLWVRWFLEVLSTSEPLQ